MRRGELAELGFYQSIRKVNPDEFRVELRLKTDHSLIAWFHAENKPCGDDRKINGNFEFVLLNRFSAEEQRAVQSWLMERFPPFSMRAVMWYETEAA